jgi:hypothetical protein
MQVRAAIAVLPPGMPDFFRSASEQLIFLSTEPDRWRTAQAPGATEATGPNHIFAYELANGPLAPTRHAFIRELVERGILSRENESLRRVGLAPWAIQEWSEMLTDSFRRWRSMPVGIPKRQQEQNIIFMAGVLAHWITDTSQPMHCSVHVLGWSAKAPNPHGYTTTPDLHGRYESDFVNHAVEDADVQTSLREMGPGRVLKGDWLQEARQHIAACNTHVERIYQWDLEAPFGSGKEPREAKAFTARRLAEGAAMLRDVWMTAWTRSL